MSKRDEFDVLSFYIYVMVLLTVVVGGFALWNRSKLRKEISTIAAEREGLKDMEAVADNKEFKERVARERQNKAGGGTVPDFQALYLNRAQRAGLVLDNHAQEGLINHRGTVEIPFRLSFNRCRVENLVKFLLTLEEEWPGCRVKQIVKLDFRAAKEGQGEGAWEAVVLVSIFRQPNA